MYPSRPDSLVTALIHSIGTGLLNPPPCFSNLVPLFYFQFLLYDNVITNQKRDAQFGVKIKKQKHLSRFQLQQL